MAFGIDMGPSSQENQQYNNLSGLSNSAANLGLQDIGQSSGFLSAILSGDPTKIGQVLSPQIQAIQGQGQQKLQTNAQFGNRGGGTNASNQTTGDQTRSGIQNMVSSLTSSAASGLGSMGSSLIGQGMSGFGTAFNQANTMQNQSANQWNNLIGGIGSVTGGVLGALPGNAGGGLDVASNLFGSL